MKLLLCTVPDGPLKMQREPLIPRKAIKCKDNENPTFPMGILRVLAAVQESGYDGEIYDLNNLRHSDEQLIENFKKIQPDVVGLSGPLSHCYPNLKNMAKIIRELFPKAWIVIGGHISGSANVVLRKTDSAIIVVGDG